MLAFGLLASAAQKKGAAGSLFAPEKGKFNILLDGKSVGHEDFEIVASGGGWTAHGTTSIKPPEGALPPSRGTLTLQPDGVPMSYEWSSQAEKSASAHVVFANGVAKMTLQLQGARPFEQDLSFSSPLIVVLDNNLYHQYAVLARVYDWSKRGTQSFPVLIPQDLTPGTITVDWAGRSAPKAKSYEGLKVSRTTWKSHCISTAIIACTSGSPCRQSLCRPRIVDRRSACPRVSLVKLARKKRAAPPSETPLPQTLLFETALSVPMAAETREPLDAAANSPADHGRARVRAHSNGWRVRYARAARCHSPARAAAAGPGYR